MLRKSWRFSEICKSGFTGGICNDRQKDANGKSVVINQIYDPCAGRVNVQGACPGSTATPAPFAGNIIPAGRINPVSAKLLNLWPAPNNANVSTNNFTTVPAQAEIKTSWFGARTTTSKPGRGFFSVSATGAY